MQPILQIHQTIIIPICLFLSLFNNLVTPFSSIYCDEPISNVWRIVNNFFCQYPGYLVKISMVFALKPSMWKYRFSRKLLNMIISLGHHFPPGSRRILSTWLYWLLVYAGQQQRPVRRVSCVAAGPGAAHKAAGNYESSTWLQRRRREVHGVGCKNQQSFLRFLCHHCVSVYATHLHRMDHWVLWIQFHGLRLYVNTGCKDFPCRKCHVLLRKSHILYWKYIVVNLFFAV